MTSPLLLAKTPRDKSAPVEGETFLGHCRMVGECFKALFCDGERPSQLAVAWLLFFRLSLADFDAFHINGLVSALVHDIGKAGSGFQDAVSNLSLLQPIRHEHLSGLILYLPEVRQWLFGDSRLDEYAVLGAVIGHHFKAKFDEFATIRNSDVADFSLATDGVERILGLAGAELGLPSFDGCVPSGWSFKERAPNSLFCLREDMKRHLSRMRLDVKRDEQRGRLLMAIRAGLILADASGSAVVRQGNCAEWVRGVSQACTPFTGGDIEARVIAPRLRQIEFRTSRPFEWRSFQDAAEALPDRSLLLSSCGSGKTLAAWRWIKGRLAARPKSRVIFLYPTRGTATEGFKDYVSWAPEADAALVHGTAGYELDGMFTAPDDERTGRTYAPDEGLYALGYWRKRIFSATVDQFLGFMQHAYGSICLLPLLADSVLVIDEVHSFDRGLFSALVHFLNSFDLPVLCMTASLPPARRRKLEESGLSLFPDDPDEFNDLKELAEAPRYAVEIIGSESAAEAKARAAFAEGKRVLWVVNTVDRCQAVATRLGALCYHSRFRLMDRKGRHEAVMEAFQGVGRAVLAVTTQVCEMSLDIDADVLISETAPLTSLIQRMGRCNRWLRPGRLGLVLLYRPDHERPYTQIELAGLDKFLSALADKVVSQAKLEELLDEHGPTEAEAEKYSAFLGNGPWAAAGPDGLRDRDGFTVQAVLDTDLDEYAKLRGLKKSIDGLLLPVPLSDALEDARLGRFIRLADGTRYSSEFGFLKHPLR